jgi:hypothetical protein
MIEIWLQFIEELNVMRIVLAVVTTAYCTQTPLQRFNDHGAMFVPNIALVFVL